MQFDPQSGATGGGLTMLLLVAYYGAKMALDRLKERRKAQRPGVELASVTDAAATNAMVLKSLTHVSAENDRLTRKLAGVEDKLNRAEAEIEKLRAELANKA